MKIRYFLVIAFLVAVIAVPAYLVAQTGFVTLGFVSFGAGATTPGSCSGPSWFYNSTSQTWLGCTTGTYVAIGGSGTDGVTSAGNLATGNVVTGASGKAVQDSGIAATAVVTLTGTQSPTNKTLLGASSGNNVTKLCNPMNSAATTGTGSAAVLATCTIPANTLGANGCVNIHASIKHTTGSASLATTITWNGTTIAGLPNSTAAAVFALGAKICNMGATNSQAWMSTLAEANATNGTMLSGTSAVDTTASRDITFTMNVAATDTVTLVLATVDLSQ